MMELPKRGRGRPSKADIAAREAAKAEYEKTQAGQREAEEAEFLDEITSQHKGRKELVEVNEQNLRIIFQMAKIMCSQAEIAAVLGCADRTFRAFMERHPEARQAWEDGTQVAKVSLRRKQFAQADKSAPMAIFLGKNYLGQRDENHHVTTVNKPANEMTEEQLLELAERGLAAKSKSTQKPGPTMQ